MGRMRMCATFRLNGLDGESEGTECPLGVANPFNGDENVDELAYEDDPDWNRFVLGGDDELGESKISRGRLSMARGRITRAARRERNLAGVLASSNKIHFRSVGF
jgi:hypothetical protein